MEAWEKKNTDNNKVIIVLPINNKIQTFFSSKEESEVDHISK
jgi:hypothetical protein